MERENGNAIKGIFQSLQAIVKSLQVIKAYRRRAEKVPPTGHFIATNNCEAKIGKYKGVQTSEAIKWSNGYGLRGIGQMSWLFLGCPGVNHKSACRVNHQRHGPRPLRQLSRRSHPLSAPPPIPLAGEYLSRNIDKECFPLT